MTPINNATEIITSLLYSCPAQFAKILLRSIKMQMAKVNNKTGAYSITAKLIAMAIIEQYQYLRSFVWSNFAMKINVIMAVKV